VSAGATIGGELGGYRLEALVGRGGMSAVYRAADLRLGRRVAVKVLASELAQDERFRARFLAESRLAASIDHANIVPIFEAGEAGGLLFIAMRYVEGTDMRALLRGAPLAPERAVALVAQLADALDAAHARGLVHRDVKPSNALVAVEGAREHVYLADFGLTKHTTSRGGPTATGQMVGTVDYVAPEQIRGDEVDGRADLYSLGCVLFECLTGEVPFPRRSEVATIYAHLEETPPRASDRCAEVPPALDAVVARALAKKPNRRVQTGAELAALAATALGGAASGPDRRGAGSPGATQLPRPPNRLLGREREVEHLAGLLVSDGVRLVSLTGPGGVGKTRLALHVARELLSRFEEVLLVELAAVRDWALVLPGVAAALGIREGGASSVAESLARELGDREVLVVLDNFEQVVAAAAALGELLARTGGLRLLVTSRRPLRLAGEHVVAIAPLAVDDAAELFVERARATGHDATANEADAEAIAAICTRLDGLPLAIELAAARTPTLPPRALLRRLDHRLELLTVGARGVHDRQSTLLATLDWSHGLLDERDQVLLRRLAVFAGGFTAEAADEVCGGDAVLDGLAVLIEHSLLRRDVAPDGEPRFAMLETIREYATRKLRASGEVGAVRARHANHTLALAERIEPDLLAGHASAFDLLALEHDNVRAALDWARTAARHDVELRLAGAVWLFWYVRLYEIEGLARLDAALAGGGAPAGAARAKALRGRGLLCGRLGRLDQTEADGRELLALAEHSRDASLRAIALQLLGSVAHVRGDYERARTLAEEVAALSREAGDASLLVNALSSGLADIALVERRFEDAAALSTDAVEIARAAGNVEGGVTALANLASALLALGRAEEATERFAESLRYAQEIRDPESIAWALEGLGATAAALGQPRRAARLLGAADTALTAPLQAFEAGRHKEVIGQLHDELGDVAFAAAWAEGQSMTPDDARAFALDEPVRARL
jgi:non-specific serine/threonine protein kinase